MFKQKYILFQIVTINNEFFKEIKCNLNNHILINNNQFGILMYLLLIIKFY